MNPAILKSFCDQTLKVEKIPKDPQSHHLTVKAMKSGADVIYQASLELESFKGPADFLIKVNGGSALGDYHYEVWDPNYLEL